MISLKYNFFSGLLKKEKGKFFFSRFRKLHFFYIQKCFTKQFSSKLFVHRLLLVIFNLTSQEKKSLIYNFLIKKKFSFFFFFNFRFSAIFTNWKFIFSFIFIYFFLKRSSEDVATVFGGFFFSFIEDFKVGIRGEELVKNLQD